MLTHIDLYEPYLASIVSWQSHGRCFIVRDADRFEEHVLPRFFKMAMYTSFRRQLNIWGFKRLAQKTHDDGAYYHELFLRSKPFLIRNIVRNRQRSYSYDAGVPSTTRAFSYPGGEPNFFSMVPLPPSACCSAAGSTNGGPIITAALLHNDAVNATSSLQVTSTSTTTSTGSAAAAGVGISSYENRPPHTLAASVTSASRLITDALLRNNAALLRNNAATSAAQVTSTSSTTTTSTEFAAGAGISSYNHRHGNFAASATSASRPVSFADNLSSSAMRTNDQQDLSSPQGEEVGCDLFSLLDHFSLEHQRRSIFLRSETHEQYEDNTNSNSSSNTVLHHSYNDMEPIADHFPAPSAEEIREIQNYVSRL